MFLAEQLNHTDAEIVYLDFSPVSLAITRRRANIRNLRNIVWINDWIENIPHLHLGKFDFIESSGVLHHLRSPARGLSILHNCLKDEGGMKIMLYGRIGRTYIYLMQDILNIINQGETAVEEEIQNVKAVTESFPSTNVYLHELRKLSEQQSVASSDHAHLYDLYLHKRDVSYSFPDLLNFINSGGFHFVNYDNFFDRSKIEVSRYLAEPLNKGVKTKIDHNRAIAELISGDVTKHEIYVSKINNSEADVNDLDNVMYLYGQPKGLRSLLDAPSTKNNGFVKGLVSSAVLTNWKDVPVSWSLSSQSTELLHFLLRSNPLNQTKSLKQLFQNLRKRKHWKMSDEKILSRIKDLFFAGRNSGQLLLRSVNTPIFPKELGTVLFSFKPK